MAGEHGGKALGHQMVDAAYPVGYVTVNRYRMISGIEQIAGV
jgi:hypothetical protein